MASAFSNAVAQEIADQPTWLRYKGSIIIVVSGIVSIIAQIAASPDFAGTQWATIFTGIATVAGFALNRFTQDGLTPSMGAKIEQAAQRVYADIPFETGPVTTVVEVRSPEIVPTEYVGEHRAADDGLADGAAARAITEAQHLTDMQGR